MSKIAVVIDNEKCKGIDHSWWVIHGSLRDAIGGLSGIKSYKEHIIKQLLDDEEISPKEREKHHKIIRHLDNIFGDILTKCKEMKEIEEELFYFLPNKPFSFNL